MHRATYVHYIICKTQCKLQGPKFKKQEKLFPFLTVSLSTYKGGILICDLLLPFLELRDTHWACVDPQRCPQPTCTTQHVGTCPPAPGPRWGTVQRKSPGGVGRWRSPHQRPGAGEAEAGKTTREQRPQAPQHMHPRPIRLCLKDTKSIVKLRISKLRP